MASTATPAPSKKETAEELLQRLEKSYADAERALADHRDQMVVLQNASFKAFREFSETRTQYLVAVINNQNEKLKIP